MSFAGSALKQGVGNLNRWEMWKPSVGTHGWLLISGGTKGIKREYFLKGTKSDLHAMKKFIRSKNLGVLHNVLRVYDLERNEVLKRIEQFLVWCRKTQNKPVIYYTGHGEVGTGNWVFSDGYVSIR